VSDALGACLGIPGTTADRAVFPDGPVTGATVLVHGVLGGVGSLAAQLAPGDTKKRRGWLGSSIAAPESGWRRGLPYGR